MNRYNNGLVFTNTNCIACNKCVALCSVIGANVCADFRGQRIISVNENKCDNCGKCINECIHNAREYKDDTVSFFGALSLGEKISLIVDQSFYVIYGDKAPNVIAWLKSKGVDKVYDLAYGAEISVWAHVKYLFDNQELPPQKKAFIANTCSSFINEVELYNPGLRYKIIPVQSPELCTAIYARKYLNDTNKIACLSSCISKKDEFKHPNNIGMIDFNVTYRHLDNFLNINELPEQGENADLSTDDFGQVLCGEGTFKDCIAKFFSNEERCISISNANEKVFEQMNFFMNEEYAATQPFLAEISWCEHGCQLGPAYEKDKIDYPYIYSCFDQIYKKTMDRYKTILNNYSQNRVKLYKKFENLNYADFEHKFLNRYRQLCSVPEEVIDEIFSVMLKDTDSKKHVNCGSCGYSTCYDMAKALAYGYNKKENCIHYMNDVMDKNYNTDALTGLDNQAGLTRKVNSILASNVNKQYSLYTGNINKLKVINDIFGFEKGNEVIKSIGQTLSKAVGSKGIVGRVGGGLFCIFVEHDLEMVQTLRNIKTFDCSHLEIEMPVTVRFGVYVSENLEDTFTDMLGYATLCMDQGTTTAVNTYSFFSQEYREKMKQEVNITAQMPVALRNNEFVLWYQPQYKTGSVELVGAEALCRWIKPDGTIVPPDVFIPIAEKNEFIVNLDKRIWRMAFEKMKYWLDSGIKPVPVSVNISRVSLKTDSLVYTIKRLDEEFQIPHEYIHFEITESAYSKDIKAVIERINRIRELGFMVAMDDFGSGYSSLNSLKDIPIDMIKLDMGFMKSSSNMDKGGNVISSVVHMAQALELITIAEGVETNSQANFLTSVGCDIIQGFLYSRPLPVQEFETLLKNTKRRIVVEKPHVFGNLNVNNFYNPESSENLMFEQFTGPAAIFEFNSMEYRAKLIRMNNRTVNLFGAQEISISELSTNIRNYFSAETRSIILDTMQSVIADKEEKACVAECTNIKKQSSIWVKFHYWLLSTNGNKHTVYCLMEDITEEKLAENTLMTTNAQMSMLMDNSSVGLLLFDMKLDLKHPVDGVKLRVIKYNKQFLELSGYSEEEVSKWTEKESLGVIHPLDKPKFIAKNLKAYVTNFEKPVSCVYRARHKSGYYQKVKIIFNGIKQDKGSYFLATSYINLYDDSIPLDSQEDSESEL